MFIPVKANRKQLATQPYCRSTGIALNQSASMIPVAVQPYVLATYNILHCWPDERDCKTVRRDSRPRSISIASFIPDIGAQRPARHFTVALRSILGLNKTVPIRLAKAAWEKRYTNPHPRTLRTRFPLCLPSMQDAQSASSGPCFASSSGSAHVRA